MAEESLSHVIKANVSGFKRLHVSLTGRTAESTAVSEIEFMKLCAPIVTSAYSPRSLISEIYRNVLLLER